MAAPGPDGEGATRPASDRAPALGSVRDSLSGAPALRTLLKRRDFLAAARARRWAAPGMVVQGRRRRDGEPTPAAETRVGYTCSKKVGNAVRRNRAKRRLRAAARDVLPRLGRPGWDYVLIGRHEATAARPFPALLGDLETALAKLHAPPAPSSGRR